MSRRNRPPVLRPQGFTLVELTVVIVMIGIIVVPAYTFFNTSFSQYISLQKEGSGLSDLTMQSQRIANVLRGITDINTATADELDCYAYFAPSDAYVSRIRYYKSADGKQLLADVTRMTSNPPVGQPVPGSLKTYTIIDNFYQQAGVSTFAYLDDTGATLNQPVEDLQIIKGIKVALAVPGGNLSDDSNQTISAQVTLRNRKTNL